LIFPPFDVVRRYLLPGLTVLVTKQK